MISRFKYLLVILIIPFCYCSNITTPGIKTNSKQFQVLKLKMFLDAFGVEADGFPTICATINFVSDSGLCYVSYYEPWLKAKQYSFSKKQIDTIRALLENVDLKEMKKEYTKGPTDQPTSTTTFYTIKDTFEIKDYGLQAGHPLPELYRIIYNLKQNFR